eukprot:s913_g24.t1
MDTTDTDGWDTSLVDVAATGLADFVSFSDDVSRRDDLFKLSLEDDQGLETAVEPFELDQYAETMFSPTTAASVDRGEGKSDSWEIPSSADVADKSAGGPSSSFWGIDSVMADSKTAGGRKRGFQQTCNYMDVVSFKHDVPWKEQREADLQRGLNLWLAVTSKWSDECSLVVRLVEGTA